MHLIFTVVLLRMTSLRGTIANYIIHVVLLRPHSLRYRTTSSLHSCIEHLEPFLRNSTDRDWSLAVAHFLGVDHVGHRYHANHPVMRQKLQQMNTVLGNVIHAIDSHPKAEDILLMVMGDHGMTEDGNHGG